MSKNKNRSAWEEIKSTGMTAMIDVTFLLLIFFMLAAKFKTAEGQMNSYLPKNKGMTRGIPKEEKSIRVVLRWCKPSGYQASSNPRWGRPVLKVGDPLMKFHLFEQQGRPDFAGLVRFIDLQKRNRGTREKMEVIIDSDPLVPWNWVIQTVDSLVGTGIKKVSFAAREE